MEAFGGQGIRKLYQQGKSMNNSLNQRFPNLADVSIAILEAKIESVLGKDAIRELKSPVENRKLRERLVDIAKRAESRVIAKYPTLGTSLEELPIADLPSIRDAILAFYENPTDIETIKGIETQIRAILPKGYSNDEIVNATSDYFQYIWEEMASLPDIRDKLSAVATIRNERNTLEITRLLQSIDRRLAELSIKPTIFDYTRGIQLLKSKAFQTDLDDNRKSVLLKLEARLQANLSEEQRFGSTGALLAERADIIKELEVLSVQVNSDFSALCRGEIFETGLQIDTPDISTAELELIYKSGQELEKAGFNYEAAAKYWRIWQLQPEYRDVITKLQELDESPQGIFVNRENEINTLLHLLDQSRLGNTSIAFLSGEAGTGKTYLVREFIRKAQSKYENLVYATGTCVAQSGKGDPFSPYKEVLSLLCGDIESQLSQANITITNAYRLFLSAPLILQLVPQTAPNLINALISSAFLNTKQREYKVRPIGIGRQSPTQSFETAISAFANSVQNTISAEILLLLREISERYPLVIFVDDLQWGDTASIDLLHYLATKLHNARVFFVGAFRTSETLSSKSSLPSYIRELRIRHPQLGEIDLDKPDESFVGQFTNIRYPNNLFLPDFITKIQSHAGGNALFVSELFQYFEDVGLIIQDANGMWVVKSEFDFSKLPLRVENVIEERISNLEDAARNILDAASVEGEEFTAQVLVKLYNLEERKLLEQLSNELEQKWHLVAASRTVSQQQKRLYLYRFRHALVRMYIYSKISANEKELLHRDIGLLLESIYETNPQQVSPLLAEHFSRAGCFDKEAKYRLISAQESIKVGVKETALFHLDRLETILDFIPSESHLLSKQLYRLRGNIFALMPLPEKAKTDFVKLEKAALADNDNVSLIQALCGYSILERSLGNFNTALDFVSRAEAIAETITEKETGDLIADCRLLSAKINRDLGNYEQVLKEATLALAEYEITKKVMGILDANSQIAYAHYAQGQYIEAEIIWKSNLTQFPEYANLPQDPDDDVYYCLGFLNWRLGKYNEAKEFLTKALESALQVGNHRKQAYCLNNLGFVETSLQNYEKAESILREASAVFLSIGDKKGQSWALGNLGNALAQNGKLDEAIGFLKENRKLAEQIYLRSDLAESDRRLGQTYLRLGNISEAYYHANLALIEAQEISRQAFVGLANRLLGEIAVATKSARNDIAIDMKEPDAYFETSVHIAKETGNVAEEKASLFLWGKYLMMLQDLSSQARGKAMIQRANDL